MTHRHPPRLPVAFLAMTALALPASAQTVYKCEAGGHVSYQATPCTGSTGKVLALEPPPPASEVEAAKRRAAALKASADGIPSPAAPVARRAAIPGLIPTTAVKCARLARRLQSLQQRHASSLAGARHGIGVMAGSRADDAIGTMASEIVSVQEEMKSYQCPGT